MNKSELDEFFRILSACYPNFEFTEDLLNYWSNDLTQYSYADVIGSLKHLKEDEKYSNRPPQLEVITKRLPKISEKVDFNKIVYFCQFCRRPFNNIDNLHNHEDRCSAIRYIEKQCLKYNLKFDNNKKIELYKMAQEEFDTNYNNFLKNIYLKSNNSYEKQLISFILNPPEREIVKEFLNNQK